MKRWHLLKTLQPSFSHPRQLRAKTVDFHKISRWSNFCQHTNVHFAFQQRWPTASSVITSPNFYSVPFVELQRCWLLINVQAENRGKEEWWNWGNSEFMLQSLPEKYSMWCIELFTIQFIPPKTGLQHVGWAFDFRIRISFSEFRFWFNSGSLKTFSCVLHLWPPGAAGFIWEPFQTAACLRGPTLHFSRWLFSLNLNWPMMVLFIKDCPEIWAIDDCPCAG